MTAEQKEVFLSQADLAEGRSPLYAALWRKQADDRAVAEIVGDPTWDSPLRLAAGLHYLVLTGEATWDSIDDDRAIAALRQNPPELIHGDAALLLPAVLAERQTPGALTIVWQTAVLGYLPADRRQLVRNALDEAGSWRAIRRFTRRIRPLARTLAGRAARGTRARRTSRRLARLDTHLAPRSGPDGRRQRNCGCA